MLLKKQTVWLLTMLSLVVVLSVYYVTTPEPQGSDIAAVDQDVKSDTGKKKETAAGQKDDPTVVTGTAGDAAFEELRMDLTDHRNKMKEEYEVMAGSGDLSPEKRSEAIDQIKSLNEIAQKEEVLETLIKTMGYDDVLVRADGGQVRVTVKSKKEHSPAAANEIIREVRKEISDMKITAVQFQPSK